MQLCAPFPLTSDLFLRELREAEDIKPAVVAVTV
jgi:hypothetical protein